MPLPNASLLSPTYLVPIPSDVHLRFYSRTSILNFIPDKCNIKAMYNIKAKVTSIHILNAACDE